MFKKYMKKVLAFTLAASLAFSGAQIAGVGGADVASAAVTAGTASITILAGSTNAVGNVAVSGGTFTSAETALADDSTVGSDVVFTSASVSKIYVDVSKMSTQAGGSNIALAANAINVGASVAAGDYTVKLKGVTTDTDTVTLTVTVTTPPSAGDIVVNDSATKKIAGFLDDASTAYASTDYDGFLYVPAGSSGEFELTGADLGASKEDIEVLSAPAGWTIKGTKVSSADATSVVTITPSATAASTDINKGTNLKIKIGSVIFKLVATNSDYSQVITGKDSINLSTSAGNVTYASLVGSSYAALDGFVATSRQWTADTALQDIASFTSDGTNAATAFSDVAFSGVATIAAKAAGAGKSGTITFKNVKGELSFTINNAAKKIAVAEATKAVKVNVLSEAKASSKDIIVNTQNKEVTIPFKVLLSSSADITAIEVADDKGTALPYSKNVATIDNDAQTIKIKKYGTQAESTYVNFVPKDSTKSGTGTIIKFTTGTSGDSLTEKGIMPSSVALDAGTFTDVALTSNIAYNDSPTLGFKFEKDTIDGLISAAYYKDATPTAPAAGENYTLARVTAKAGVPGGTYTAYAYKIVNKVLTFQKVSVVITSEAKDIPANIGVNKVDGTKVSSYAAFSAAGVPADGYTKAEDLAAAKAKYKTVELLSGNDHTLTFTSLIAAAGTVSDIALGQVQVEDPATGARITDGFTINGMDLKISADKLVAGKSYYVFVTTKGSGISESNTMVKGNGVAVTSANEDGRRTCILITTKQGYVFKYNIGNASVKAGKELKDVSVSSDSVNQPLEDGSNLEYIGASFLGWSYTDGATKADITAADAKKGLSQAQIKTALDKNVNGDINLYAVWDYTTYTVSYDANGGAGTETGKNFTVAATDFTLPSTGFTKGDKPLVGWTTTSTGKTAAGATLPVYTGTLNSAQLQAIVKENDPELKKAAITLYAQYGAALKSVSINPATLDLTVGGATGLVTASALDEDGNASSAAVISFTSDNPGVATVDASGVVTAVAEGTANITATATLGNVSVTSASACVVTVKAAEEPVVTKKANTLTVKAKTVTVKKGKKVTLKVAKVLTVKNAKGTVTYTKKSGNKKITIKKTTGKVTVKKGLKKGTYKVKVAVKAAGNASYKAKTVTKTFKIKVK